MKKTNRSWNRVHYFKRKKSNSKRVGHPVYVYKTSGRYSTCLVFTHSPEAGKEQYYERLKHNIDPNEDGVRNSYVKTKPETTRSDSLLDPDRKYRIHRDDMPLIRKYKK